ncbi:MAG: YqgE/AlgH family protein, partial [Acidimicrobiales bacterium]
MSTRGRHLVASPSLNDPNFEFTVVFMLEHSDEGALGVVLTRPSELPVTDMFEGWVDHAAAPSVVFRGGPVSLSSVIALGVAASAGPSGGFNPIAA